MPKDAKEPAGKKPAKETKNVPELERSREKNLTLKDFDSLGRIGRGKFGDIHHVRDKGTKKCLVLKHIYLNRLDQATLARLRQEVEIQRKLCHPNILRGYRYFQEGKRLFIMVGYAHGGTMFDFI